MSELKSEISESLAPESRESKEGWGEEGDDRGGENKTKHSDGLSWCLLDQTPVCEAAVCSVKIIN